MEKFKNFLGDVFYTFLSGLYVWFIIILPAIGIVLDINYGWWWMVIIFVSIDFILIEAYGRNYFRINKHAYKDKMKLKVHHYVDENRVWLESNDIIDSVIDTEVLSHEKLDW